ncbi:MAG TPA: TIGR01459 family HAD-type hydrolase [Devosiaceae bacterium]|jgi:HAD superfamily hydrolase (TIGR01459 family)
MPESAGASAGLAALSKRYDVLLSDVWGVVHNGLAAYPSAVEALVKFREQGGCVVLITNAPRPSAPIVDMLNHLGVPHTAYDAIVSSGDATRSLIAQYRGQVIHHVGPPVIDDALYEGLGIIRGSADEAVAVVVTDLDTDDDTPDMYADRIAHWLKRGLPLICANPDKVVEVGDQIVYCGGALADIYAELGGEVRMAGKPFAPIYDEALRLAEAAVGHKLDRRRIMAIGDSVRTDAIGAADFGIDLLFITGSIHAGELDAFGAADPEAIRALVAPSGAALAGFMPRLAW